MSFVRRSRCFTVMRSWVSYIVFCLCTIPFMWGSEFSNSSWVITGSGFLFSVFWIIWGVVVIVFLVSSAEISPPQINILYGSITSSRLSCSPHVILEMIELFLDARTRCTCFDESSVWCGGSYRNFIDKWFLEVDTILFHDLGRDSESTCEFAKAWFL